MAVAVPSFSNVPFSERSISVGIAIGAIARARRTIRTLSGGRYELNRTPLSSV
jgi:hypothetical protein